MTWVRNSGGALLIPPSAGGGGIEPFLWYPALDLSEIPQHVGSGAHGVQHIIVAPTQVAPGGTSVNVNSDAGFQSAYDAGTRTINITGDFNGGNLDYPSSGVDNVDIVLPAGRYLEGLRIRQPQSFGANRKVRIRGSTLGDPSSGGTIENLVIEGYFTDVHVDGVGITAEGVNEFAGLWLNSAEAGVAKIDRITFTNCQINTACDCSILTGYKTLVIAGCSFNSGLLGYPGETLRSESWGIRGRPEQNSMLVLYDNDIRGSRGSGDGLQYHRVRLHPAMPGTGGNNVNNGSHAFIAENNFVDRLDSTFFLVDASYGLSGSASHGKMSSVVMRRNRIYMTGGSPAFDIRGDNNTDDGSDNDAAFYVEHTNNTYYGDFTSGHINIANATNGVVNTGNAFNVAVANPAWGGAGDPTGRVWN